MEKKKNEYKAKKQNIQNELKKEKKKTKKQKKRKNIRTKYIFLYYLNKQIWIV